MSVNFLDAAAEAYDAIVMCVDTAFDDVIEFGSFLGRNVEDWTNKHLPKPLNIITQRAFNSLPVILAWQLLPFYITASAFVIFGIAHLVTEAPFSAQTYRNVYDGTAFDSVIDGTTQFALFMATGNFGYFAGSCIQAILAACFFNRTNAIN